MTTATAPQHMLTRHPLHGCIALQPAAWYAAHAHEHATQEERDKAYCRWRLKETCASLIELRDAENARHQIEIRRTLEALQAAQARCEHELTGGACVVCGWREQ